SVNGELTRWLNQKYQLVPQGLVFNLADGQGFHDSPDVRLQIRGLADGTLRFGKGDPVNIKVLPVYTNMLINRGRYLALFDQHERAIVAFEQALALNPDLAFAIGAIPIRAADNVIALKAAHMFDGKSKSLVPNGVVIVQGDKIIDVASNLAVPGNAQIIDLGDATLAPGFMDAHTHLTLDYSGDYNVRRLQELDLNVSEQAIIATAHARATVEAGFTT